MEYKVLLSQHSFLHFGKGVYPEVMYVYIALSYFFLFVSQGVWYVFEFLLCMCVAGITRFSL